MIECGFYLFPLLSDAANMSCQILCRATILQGEDGGKIRPTAMRHIQLENNLPYPTDFGFHVKFRDCQLDGLVRNMTLWSERVFALDMIVANVLFMPGELFPISTRFLIISGVCQTPLHLAADLNGTDFICSNINVCICIYIYRYYIHYMLIKHKNREEILRWICLPMMTGSLLSGCFPHQLRQ